MTTEIRVGEYIILKDRLYTQTHEWIKTEDSIGIVGITDYAQKELQDITYVELPETDIEVSKEEEVATVESVKHTSPIYSPVSGRIIEVNERLEDDPDLVNKDPYGEGWIFKIELSDPEELKTLLTAEEYAGILKEEKS